MGTETYLHRVYKLSHCQILVKLNNPLMGTETLQNNVYQIHRMMYVELNNPQMGTETK